MGIAPFLLALALVGQRTPRIDVVKWFNTPQEQRPATSGRVVLIEFWSVHCGPCMASIPKLQKLSERYASRGLTVVLVHDPNVWGRTEKGIGEVRADLQVRDFIARKDVKLPVGIADKNVWPAFGIDGIPHYVLLDRSAVIRYSAGGNAPDETLIEELLR